MVKRAIEGIKVNEDTIGLDVIKKVATCDKKGVNFLAERHTRDYMKSELYFPNLADRNRRNTWFKKGAKDIVIRAREKVDQILQTHKSNDLPEDLNNELIKFIKIVESRTFDDYRKAEGLTVSKITLPDGIEIKEDND